MLESFIKFFKKYLRGRVNIKNSKWLLINTQHSKKIIKLKANKINISNHKEWESYFIVISKSFGKNYAQVIVWSK